jgi:hypothetical protein
MRFTIDVVGAARLYLIARGRGMNNWEEDLAALSSLIGEFQLAGYRMGLDNADRLYCDCERADGKMIKCQGESEDCPCFRCRLKKEFNHATHKEEVK